MVVREFSKLDTGVRFPLPAPSRISCQDMKRDEPRFLICKAKRIYEAYMHHVYVLISLKDKSWYIGETADIKRRVKDHNNGLSRYTNQHRPYKLIYLESYVSKKDAKGREKYLKSGPGHTRLKIQLKDTLKISSL